MYRLATLALIVAVLAPISGGAQDRTFTDRFAYLERVGNWAITCTDFARRLDGKMEPYNSCSLRRVLKRGTLEGGNALTITAVHGRETIHPAIGDRHCSKQPHARFVDEIFIRNLPMERQIDLLKTGTLYSEEYMPRKWPECWIVVRTARLDGFEAAYLRFREISRERGALW